MLFLLYFLGYLAAAVLSVQWLLPRLSVVRRAVLSLALSVTLAMALPALAATVWGYTVLGHALALVPLLLLTLLAYILRDKAEKARGFGDEDKRLIKTLAFTALPLTVVMALLFSSHLIPETDGALYTGQSCYGDLPLHLSIATSLKGATLPADYSLLPGTRLSYPFLPDALSTSFLVFGSSLRQAFVMPSILLAALAFCAFVLLADTLAGGRRKVVILAFYMVFLNGGLGFLYPLDMLGRSLGNYDSRSLQWGVWGERLRHILTGWYQTPANHAAFTTYNLRASNILCDMLLPQRSFLFGFALVMPAMDLVLHHIDRDKGLRASVLCALLSGLLPLIHTHAFLALGLFCLGFFCYRLMKRQPVGQLIVFGVITVLIALPQLVFFTFRQAGGSGFVRFQYNWVNNPGGEGLLDFPPLFWLKNLGLPFVLMVLALFQKNSPYKAIFAGAGLLFVISNLILFQPNEYDNYKLFVICYALLAVPAADMAAQLFHRLKGVSARPLLAVLACVALFTSGLLALGREFTGRYELFGAQGVALSRFADQNMTKDSLLMAAPSHVNPVSALSGKRVVAGPDLWLHWHGLDTADRQRDIQAFYEQPDRQDILDKYGVTHILLSPEEMARYGTEPARLDALYDRLYGDPEGAWALYGVKGR